MSNCACVASNADVRICVGNSRPTSFRLFCIGRGALPRRTGRGKGGGGGIMADESSRTGRVVGICFGRCVGDVGNGTGKEVGSIVSGAATGTLGGGMPCAPSAAPSHGITFGGIFHGADCGGGGVQIEGDVSCTVDLPSFA